MNSINVHDAFVPHGCASSDARPAVSVQAGAIWMQVYDAVTTQHGRYVQGGGCTAVGVAGLRQIGRDGRFSKRYGIVSAGILAAEIATADGEVRLANRCVNPDLYWGIKGGGGGSLGVVTRLTLETHALPPLFGALHATIQAHSDAAYRRLIGRLLEFYRDKLLNPHWGEQIVLKENRILTLQLVSQDLAQATAEGIWQTLLRRRYRFTRGFLLHAQPGIIALPAREMWNPEVLRGIPGIVKSDDRVGAGGNVFWAGDAGQCGQVLHGYDSLWLPATLLDDQHRQGFVDALCAAAQRWEVSLHLNKGLAGALPRVIDAARVRDESGVPEGIRACHIGGKSLPLSRHPGPNRCCRGTQRRPRYPAGHGRAAQSRAGLRLLRVGEQFLREAVATDILGRQLPKAAQGQDNVRSRRTIRGPSRRRQ
jgi:hypothetical protein